MIKPLFKISYIKYIDDIDYGNLISLLLVADFGHFLFV